MKFPVDILKILPISLAEGFNIFRMIAKFDRRT